jgi:hypothetical protein
MAVSDRPTNRLNSVYACGMRGGDYAAYFLFRAALFPAGFPVTYTITALLDAPLILVTRG